MLTFRNSLGALALGLTLLFGAANAADTAKCCTDKCSAKCVECCKGGTCKKTDDKACCTTDCSDACKKCCDSK